MKAHKTKSGAYRVQLVIDGRRVSITAPTKSEAETEAMKYQLRIKTKSNWTVRDCIERYIEMSEVLSPTTLASYRKILEYAFTDIMDLNLDELDNCILQNSINAESKRKLHRTGKQISPKTVKNEWGLVSAAIKTVANRTYQVRLPKVQRKNRELPEPEEVFKRIQGTDIELPCLLAMWCGMRLSEIRGITYDAIKGNVLQINQVLVDVDNVPVIKKLAKTDLSIRKLILPDYIISLIKSQKRTKNGLVCDITRSTLYYRFTCKTEGLGISFHDLRHIYASVMLTKLNVPERIVQDSAGWKTDTVMKSVYSNSFSSSRIAADKVRDDYFSNMIVDKSSKKSAKKVQTALNSACFGSDLENATSLEKTPKPLEFQRKMTESESETVTILAEDMGLEPTRIVYFSTVSGLESAKKVKKVQK